MDYCDKCQKKYEPAFGCDCPQLSKDEKKQAIIDLVYRHQGIKATKLPVALVTDCGPGVIPWLEEIPALLFELIGNRQLIEIEYRLSKIPYRVKSFLLPADTELLNAEITQCMRVGEGTSDLQWRVEPD